MVINMRIIDPITAFNTKSLVLSKDELFSVVEDFVIISENRLYSTSNDSWIEVRNIHGRIGRLRSVIYKMKPIDYDDELETKLLYADTEQDYHDFRSFSAILRESEAIIEIPDYVGPVDKLRLHLTGNKNILLEIKEISLNTNSRFSLPLFGLIYVFWLFIIFPIDILKKQDSSST
jgi:hypothetical protein